MLQATNAGVERPGYNFIHPVYLWQSADIAIKEHCCHCNNIVNLTCATECAEIEGIHHTVSARSKGDSSPKCCVCTSQSVC